MIEYKYPFLLKAIYSNMPPTEFKQLCLNTKTIQ